MKRELIERDALLMLINEHLATLHECRNLTVGAVIQDHTLSGGANWTTLGLRQSGHDHDRVECAEVIRGFMRELQARYNVNW